MSCPVEDPMNFKVTKNLPFKCSAVLINKTLAEEMLRAMVRPQRTPRRGRVATLLASMRKGHFSLNGEFIMVSKSGHVINGQHRLIAIIEGDLEVWCCVITEIDDAVIQTLDNGSARGAGDFWDIKQAKHCAAIVRRLVWLVKPSASLSNQNVHELYELLGGDEAFSQAIHIRSAKAKHVNHTFSAAVFVYMRIHPAAATRFADDVVNMSATVGTPAHALYVAMSSNKRSSFDQMANACFDAVWADVHNVPRRLQKISTNSSHKTSFVTMYKKRAKELLSVSGIEATILEYLADSDVPEALAAE